MRRWDKDQHLWLPVPLVKHRLLFHSRDTFLAPRPCGNLYLQERSYDQALAVPWFVMPYYQGYGYRLHFLCHIPKGIYVWHLNWPGCYNRH
jgi:hypothetical protein